MNNRHFIRPVLAVAIALVAAAPLMAQIEDSADDPNHLSFAARAGFGITARFKDLGTITLPPNPRTTPNGDPYNYNNGYVYTDVSGNAGGQTWYWGYDNSTTQRSGNTILLSRSTPDPNAESPAGVGDGDPNFGWELTYDRELGKVGKLRYGVEAAVNYTRVSFSDGSSFSGNEDQVTDAYPFTPGTTPPVATPGAPYQGTFNGPGFLIGSTPVSSTTTVAGTTVIAGQRKFNSDIWGARLGPYIAYPLTERLNLSCSAGFSAGLLVNSATWNETIYVGPTAVGTSTGSGRDTAFVWGGYASANVDWEFTRHWTAGGGIEFQDLGLYQQDLGSRAIELDLRHSVFVNLSIGCKF